MIPTLILTSIFVPSVRQFIPLKHLVLIPIFLISCFDLSGQNKDSLLAFKYEDLGNLAYRQRSFDSAHLYYHRAMEIYQKLGMTEKEAEGHLRIGNTYYREQKPYKAMDAFFRSMELYKAVYSEDHITLHRPLMGLSASYQLIGKAIKYRSYQEKAHELTLSHYGADHLKSAVSYYNMGSGALEFGEYRKALSYFLKALPILIREYPDGHTQLSALYVNMGIVYSKMDDIEHAIDYFIRASEMDIALGGETNWVLAFNYLDLGQAYRKTGKDSLSELYIQKSIAIAKDNDFHEVYATGLNELGILQRESGNYDKAISLFTLAIEAVSQNLGPGHHSLGNYYSAVAEVRKEQGLFEEAETFIHEAIRVVRETYGNRHPRIAQFSNQLANLLLEWEQFDQAYEMVESGMESLHIPSSWKSPDSENEFNTVSQPLLLQLLHTKAAILEAKYHHNPNPQFLRQSVRLYDQSEKLMDRMRRGFINEGSKHWFQTQSVATYEKAINLCSRLYELSDSINYLDRAFQFSEKNKSTILSESLHAGDIVQVKDVPAEILRHEKNLHHALDQAKISLIQNPNDSILQSSLHRFQFQYDSLVLVLQNKYPRYFDLKYRQQVASVKQVIARLGKKEAMLSYFEGDSIWYIFTIEPGGIKLTEVNKSLIEGHLVRFRDMVSHTDQTYSYKIAYHLYDQLVKAPLSHLTEVDQIYIVPDGHLGYVPFDAFYTEEESVGTKGYLVNMYSISQVSSATLFCRQGEIIQKPKNTYIGFAPTYADHEKFQDNQLGDLPYAIKEINSGSQILKGEIYVNEKATEYQFKQLRSVPSVLHLAMHALVEDQHPEKSRLVFTRTDDTLEDGDLNAYEIYNIEMPSQLVILSACNTGFGKIHRGEGIMNLSRAFLYAGCPNIIMSLWQANDFPTTEIVTSFLKKLKRGKSKSKALQQAKIDYLSKADPLQAHPANWATLVLIGDNVPLDLKTSPILNILIIILVLAAALSIIKLAKRKQTSA